MWVKIVLLVLFGLMILGAVHFAQPREAKESSSGPPAVPALRLLTWNIGYAELEDDTRAHDKDLPAVADVIMRHDPDAVALQELTGDAQLQSLLDLLHGKYRGAVAQKGRGDRFEAVLVKDTGVTFIPVPAGARYALAASFRPRQNARQVVLVSAHADAFNAVRRRTYTEDLIPWAVDQTHQADVFVAGDFNFELKAANETNIYTDSMKHDGEAYSLILRYFSDLGRSGGDTAINDRRIDYIFGAFQTREPRRVEVLRDAAVGRMDHWPLLVEIEF